MNEHDTQSETQTIADEMKQKMEAVVEFIGSPRFDALVIFAHPNPDGSPILALGRCNDISETDALAVLAGVLQAALQEYLGKKHREDQQAAAAMKRLFGTTGLLTPEAS